MADRAATLRELAATLRESEGVVDAFLAKSFTDRHLIVDYREDTLPDPIRERLAAQDLRDAGEVYGEDRGHPFASDIGDAVRHHFVDVRTCGEHRSYVVE